MALKIHYLDLAQLDLLKFRLYYQQYFPEGLEKASITLQKCLMLISNFPDMGHHAGKAPRRCFGVPQTHFTLLYQARDNRLEIVRILDQRSETYLENLFGHDNPHRQ